MARSTGRLAARLDRLEAALGDHRVPFRNPEGRLFYLDVTDVLCIAVDCLTWLHDDTAERPRGPIVEQLARAELGPDQGLIGHTAIQAARHAVEGVRP